MRKDRLPFLIIGVALLAFFLFMALFPGVFTDMDRKESFGAWLPMSEEHILGTNSLGYDIFTELVYGARDTLIVGLASGLISVLLGAVVGMLSAAKGVVGVVFGGSWGDDTLFGEGGSISGYYTDSSVSVLNKVMGTIGGLATIYTLGTADADVLQAEKVLTISGEAWA